MELNSQYIPTQHLIPYLKLIDIPKSLVVPNHVIRNELKNKKPMKR